MTTLTQQLSFKNVDWKMAAGGDARDGNTSLTVNGVTGTQKTAILYWGELNFSGSSDGVITFNGTSITGEKLGTSVDTCWGSDQSVGYYADVSALVNGDGTYTIDGMGEGGQGATLYVFYDDGDATNNRDVTLFSGNDSTNTSGAVTTMNLGTLNYVDGNVNIVVSVGDGQSFTDGALTINDALLGTNQFSGSAGALWDANTYDITTVLTPGDNTLRLTHVSESDCLQFVNVLVDKPASTPVLFLDFDTRIPVDYYVTSATFLGLLGLDARETSATRAGTEPLGVFTAAQKAQLVQYVQDIFDRSGIAMDVTSTKPTSGDYHSVRFSSTELVYDTNGDGTDNARLLGQAFQGIDRYDTDKNNIVAVLMDGSDPLLEVAETVAHEGAHAFGARHINPVQGSGTEVMDYDSSGLQTFTNTVARITEPPVDGQPSTSVTHNPVYHIRRYVNGESDEQLRKEGVNPGTWDRTAFENILYSLGLSDLTQPLENLSVLVLEEGALAEGDDDGLGLLIPLADAVNADGTFSFWLPEGLSFRIVADSDGSGNLDTVLEFDPNADDPFAMTSNSSTTLTGPLVMEDPSGNRVQVADASLDVTEVEEVTGTEVLPVLTVTIDAEMFSENGGEATVTVSRGTATAGDLTVVLSSTDTSAATLPGEVVIPDGESEVQVTLSAVDDFREDGTQTTVIIAQANGYETGTASFDVLDDETVQTGTEEADRFTGTPEADSYFGLGGDDFMSGLAGNDLLSGDTGNDTAIGGPGADLLSGGPDSDVLIGDDVADVSTSPGAQVVRIYQSTLDRLPDTGGYNNWSGRLDSGERTLLQVISGFVNSPEFQETYGDLDNEGFVKLLYLNVLGREADDTGLANWVARLDDGMSREEVVRGFAQSAEFIAQTAPQASAYVTAGLALPFLDDVFRLYEATLDRDPDTGGLVNWASRLGAGAEYTSVASGFVDSPEFQNVYGALDNTGFVTLLYNNVLDRDPDAKGLGNWVGRLDDGMSRAEVVQGFAQSQEFVNQTTPAFNAFMAGTNGDRFDGGPGDDLLSGGPLADEFRFDVSDPGTDRVPEIDPWDTVSFTGFGYEDAEEAMTHLRETANDVIFTDQDVSVIFMHTDLAAFEQVTILV